MEGSSMDGKKYGPQGIYCLSFYFILTYVTSQKCLLLPKVIIINNIIWI